MMPKWEVWLVSEALFLTVLIALLSTIYGIMIYKIRSIESLGYREGPLGATIHASRVRDERRSGKETKKWNTL